MKPRYLGDGVYCSWDYGRQAMRLTSNNVEHDNVMHLTIDAFRAMQQFMDDLIRERTQHIPPRSGHVKPPGG